VRESTVSGRKVVAYCLAILSAAAAVIHFAVAGAHFQEYWAYGLFLLVVAWLQLLWAVAIAIRSSRWLTGSGAILYAAVIVVYVVTRTVGDVIGPDPHTAEPLGFADGLCTALEAAVVVGCLWLLRARDWRIRRLQLAAIPAVTGAAAAVLVSAALVTGGPEMVMSAAAGTTSHSGTGLRQQHMSMPATAGVRLSTESPAGAITPPDPNMQMEPGMQMAGSAMCTAAPTKAQQSAAVQLVNASWQEARSFRSLAVAQAAGYVPITPSGLPVVHYLNYRYYLSTMRGGPVLNTAQPQSLVYANTPKGAVLVAVMFIAPPGQATPRPGGCLTQWHVHTNLCSTVLGSIVGVVTAAHPTCPAGSSNQVTPPMMHIWFAPIPGGPTAVDASDAQIVTAAEKLGSFGNGTA
ncbi:MAG: hypothetical protein J2P28_15840, partial [Actinobacteria bacterium]|nr:hypothetical protein [Actinomycetota bacterium]